MRWVDALKIWNQGKGTWCIPKKGTAAHAEVLAIMAEKKAVPKSVSAKVDFTPTKLTPEQSEKIKKHLSGDKSNYYRSILASISNDFKEKLKKDNTVANLYFLRHIVPFVDDSFPVFQAKLDGLSKEFRTQFADFDES